MAKVHNLLLLGLDSQYLYATEKKFCGENKQITARGLIAADDDIVNTSW
jgi:hypothetical protein